MCRKQVKKDAESPQDREKIQEYAGILQRELQQAIDNIKFTNQGGKIHYVVDFSEIYAYLLPIETEEESVREFLTFAIEEAKGTAELAQLHVLRKLFWDSGKLILLTPYKTEFKSFLIRSRQDNQNSLENIANQLPNVEKEIEKLQKNSEFERFQELVKKLDESKSNEEVSSEDSKWIVDFLEENASSIVGILEPQNSRPIDRLKQLFDHQRFEELKDIGLTDTDASLAKEEESKWYNKLVKVRSSEAAIASSSLDATAITLVEQANQKLKKQNTRCFLVTRSKWMHKVFRKESDCNNNLLDFLYHPRVFIMILYKDVRPDKALQELENLQNSVERLLKDYAEYFQEQKDLSKLDSKKVSEEWEDIVEEWRKIVNLITVLDPASIKNNSLSSVSTQFHQAQIRNTRLNDKELKNVRPILQHLLQEPQKLRKLLSERLKQRIDDCWKNQEVLGLCLQGLDPEYQEYFNVVLSPDSPQPRPYSLNFYSDEAKDLFKKLRSLKDVFESLKNIYESPTYEKFLVIAHTFGNLERWKLAEIYCDEAISIDKNLDNSRHEGYFFLSICKRKWTPKISEDEEYERYKDALNCLDRAIELKKKVTSPEPHHPDLRYLLEKGTQILKLNDDKFKEKVKGEKKFSPEIGLELIKQVIKQAELLSTNNLELKIRAYNNLLFYLLGGGTRRFGEKTLRDLENNKEKKNELLSIYDNLKKEYYKEYDWNSNQWWSSLVLDTLAIAGWHFEGARNSKEKQKKINQLWEQALEPDKPLSPSERKRIEEHREQFSSWRKSI